VPGAVVAATARVKVEVPAPVIDVGLKVGVTPVGCPVADKAMDESKPPVMAEVIVDVPLAPCATETELGEAERLKPAVGAPARARSRLSPFGLPKPHDKL
jgi:hypothetical protein